MKTQTIKQAKTAKKMKRLATIAMSAILCFSLLVLCACGGNNSSSSNNSSNTSSTSTSSDNSADIKTLVVGFDNAYPPYGFIGDDGKETGFDLDLAQEVCKRNGWEYKAEAIDWDAKDALLGQGSINCIWNGFTMEGREGKYTFSDPYMKNEQVVVVKSGSSVSSLKDLANKNVITQVDSAALDVLEGDQKSLADTFAGGKATTIADYNNAFLQLDSGQVDAVACDLSIAQYQISKNAGKYTQLSESLSSENYAVGFKLGDDALAKKVTDTLKEMYEDGTVKTLCEKYADYGLSFSNWELK